MAAADCYRLPGNFHSAGFDREVRRRFLFRFLFAFGRRAIFRRVPVGISFPPGAIVHFRHFGPPGVLRAADFLWGEHEANDGPPALQSLHDGELPAIHVRQLAIDRPGRHVQEGCRFTNRDLYLSRARDYPVATLARSVGQPDQVVSYQDEYHSGSQGNGIRDLTPIERCPALRVIAAGAERVMKLFPGPSRAFLDCGPVSPRGSFSLGGGS